MTFLQRGVTVGSEFGRSSREVDRIKRNWDGAVRMLEQARQLGIKLLCGTDSGNSPLMPYGELHAHEVEILVRYGGYSPLEAITACTRDSAYVMGLEGELGILAPGKLADLIVLTADPLADIRVLQGGQHLALVIKDGQIVGRNGQGQDSHPLAFTEAALGQ
jgi:imidazolonepropionase-like amidohydrolase